MLDCDWSSDVCSSDLATSVSAGAVQWRRSLVPASDSAGQFVGGGLAYGEGKVYATTAAGELIALDAGSGGVLWRQKLDAPVGGAPAYAGGMVYVVSRGSMGWAVRAADGRMQWTVKGTPSGTGVDGVAAPAADGTTVIFPMPSGELLAADRATGQRKWATMLAGRRLGQSYTLMTDVTGDPVIAGGTVYAGTSAGRLYAIDLATGQTRWTAPEGATSPPVVAGNALFIVSDQNRLIRLDAGTGGEVWSVALPYFEKVRRDKNRRNIYGTFGPVLAGGRLLVASSAGQLTSFDPASGTQTATAPVSGGAAAAPALAGGLAFVVTRSGRLVAFR
jgi:outer membrane protein assembly factor BamB